MNWLRRWSYLKVFLFSALAATLFNGTKQFEQIILGNISKSVHWFSRRSRWKLFSIYSPGGHFVQRSGTVCLKLLSIYSPGGHFVQRSGTVWTNLCRQSHKEHSCIIISKFMNWLRRSSHLKVFLLSALAAILFNGTEQFQQVTQGTILWNYFTICPPI